MKLMTKRIIALAIIAWYGHSWFEASAALRARPERAMATITQSVESYDGCLLDIVFTDRKGVPREARDVEKYHVGRSHSRHCGGPQDVGNTLLIAYAVHAPEQALPAVNPDMLRSRLMVLFASIYLFVSLVFFKR